MLTFTQRHPYAASVLVGLLCTFLTALGIAVPQILELTETPTRVVMIIPVVASVGIGLLLMKKSRFSLTEYGFRQPRSGGLRMVWFCFPLFIMELAPIVFFGFDMAISPLYYFLISLLYIAVGFNEEIYFRGLGLKFISEKGIKKAIVWSSVIFGVLHLANAFNGKNILNLAMQLVFSFLVGVVMAELVNILESLYPVILWHIVHNFISITTHDGTDVKGLLIYAFQIAVVLIYALVLWKKLRTQPSDS